MEPRPIPCYFFPSKTKIDFKTANVLHQIGNKCWVRYIEDIVSLREHDRVGTLEKNVFWSLEKAQKEKIRRQADIIPLLITELSARLEKLEKMRNYDD